MTRPIIDTHCDLLSYLTKPFANINSKEDIGCSVPYLIEGNVKLQVMAIFAPTDTNSHLFGLQQSEIFKQLAEQNIHLYQFKKDHLHKLNTIKGVGMLAAIESAAAFCDENISLKQGLKNLETIIHNVGNVFYISLTHHSENRFGGGNYTSIGLKDDGKALVEYLEDKKIAIDLSHTSDALAEDLLSYISKQNLNIPIMASHSNYRSIFTHPRNLPNDIAQEIINKQGLIGANFVRAFVNNDRPEALQEHIEFGMKLGAENSICYGADFFYTKSHPDKTRIPFYFKEHQNATSYHGINSILEKKFGSQFCDKISFENAQNFLNRLWH